MTISHYARRILARWRLMACVTAAVFAAAVAVTLTTPVSYTSLAQLYVASLSDQPDMESVQAAGLHAQGRMLSYASVASSQEMNALIGSDLGADALTDVTIRTEVPFGTVLINLTVVAPTAQGAQDIAQSVADNYNELLTDVEGARATELKVGVSTVNSPSLPAGPSSPKYMLNLLAGLLAGLLLALAVAALRDLMDTSVRADDDDLGAPVLGRLPRLGDSGQVPSPEAGTPLAETVRRLRIRLEATGHRTVVVAAVDSAHGSTVARLVAQSMELAGRDVTLVDSDLRARTAEADALEFADSATMSDLLREATTKGRWLLLVAPPLKTYADAAALAPGVDAVLLVVRAGRTSRADLAQALTDLDRDAMAGVYVVLTDA